MKRTKDTAHMTPAEIRQAAYRAIVKELGPSGFLRFIQDTYPGRGDYTKERRDFLPQGGVREVAKEISTWKASRKTPHPHE